MWVLTGRGSLFYLAYVRRSREAVLTDLTEIKELAENMRRNHTRADAGSK